jgi:hypothetical protein
VSSIFNVLFYKKCNITSHTDTNCISYKLHIVPSCFKALWLISSGLSLLSFAYDSKFRFACSSSKVSFQFRVRIIYLPK